MMEDRELDAELERRLFGKHEVEITPTGRAISRHDPEQGGFWQQVPPYSSTWEGAGLVVEALNERGLSVRLSAWQGSCTAEVGEWPVAAAVGAPTVPVAICRAALAALEALGKGEKSADQE